MLTKVINFNPIVIVGDKNYVKKPSFKDYAYPYWIFRLDLLEFGEENLILQK